MSSSSQQPRDATTASVITRPPLLYLACLLLGQDEGFHPKISRRESFGHPDSSLGQMVN
jgi:hypothetical protein